MFSESNYSEFEKKVLERADELATQILAQAQSYARRRLAQAKREGQRLFKERAAQAEIEAQMLKNEGIAEIEARFKKGMEEKESTARELLLEALKQELEKKFPELIPCFANWVSKRFDAGTFFVNPRFYERLSSYVSEPFKVVPKDLCGIVFKSSRVIVEFSPKAIMKEFKAEIDTEIAKALEG